MKLVKIILLTTLLLTLITLTKVYADGVAYGTPEQYHMNFLSFAQSTDSGDTWVIFFESDDNYIDLASDIAPGQLAQTVSGNVQPGNYNMFRSIISSTFKIKGAIQYAPDEDEYIFYTTSSGTGYVEVGSGEDEYDDLEDFYSEPPDDYVLLTIQPPETEDTMTVIMDDDLEIVDGQTYTETLYITVENSIEIVKIGGAPGPSSPEDYTLFPNSNVTISDEPI